jgi:hypothetical protein
VLAATLLLAASAGCGDDNGNDATGGDTSPPAATTETPEPASTDPTETRPEPAPSQSRWAEQVDAACKPVQEQIDAVPPPADAAGLERWLGDILPLVTKQIAAVKAIKPPVKDEEARRAKLFVGGLEKLETAFTHYLAAVQSADPKALQKAVTQANAAGAETRADAASLELTQCGGYSSG